MEEVQDMVTRLAKQYPHLWQSTVSRMGGPPTAQNPPTWCNAMIQRQMLGTMRMVYLK